MDLTYLKYSDRQLLSLAESRVHTREANREIKRRKMVGSWRLVANWKAESHTEAEVETEERVYAPGVKRLT